LSSAKVSSIADNRYRSQNQQLIKAKQDIAVVYAVKVKWYLFWHFKQTHDNHCFAIITFI